LNVAGLAHAAFKSQYIHSCLPFALGVNDLKTQNNAQVNKPVGELYDPLNRSYRYERTTIIGMNLLEQPLLLFELHIAIPIRF
jgi:hypothetical protein